MPNQTQGEIVGWHYTTRQPLRIEWKNETITCVEISRTPPSEDIWLAPGLFDLQVNGYGGVDFQQDKLTLEQLRSAVRLLRSDGCTGFLLTLITDDWFKLTGRLRHLHSLRAQCHELQSAIVGWHVEGPFLSPEPGFHGTHNPAFMCDPTPERILELYSIVSGESLLVTLAPERTGALQAVALAVSHGIRVCLGHTNASKELLAGAVAAGASGFTHLGNGCPAELNRHDNILWRAFDTPGLNVTLIPDQIHVSPSLFRLVHRLLGFDSVCYVSDAMAAAGAPVGRYTLGKLELEVGLDQIVRQPGQPYLSGSALRPVDGVFRAAQMLRCPWQETWRRYSELPAKTMGLPCGLAAGEPASVCVLKVCGNELSDCRTYIGALPQAGCKPIRSKSVRPR